MSEGLTWSELELISPTLWRLAAEAAWNRHRREFPADSEIEQAHRINKACGHDPNLALAIPENPCPWTHNGLKPPPFTKDIAERLAKTHDLRIFIGKVAWDQAKAWHTGTDKAVTLLPPGEDPTLFDWGFCAGRVPLLINAGALCTEEEPLIKQLLAAQAVAVVRIDNQGNLESYMEF